MRARGCLTPKEPRGVGDPPISASSGIMTEAAAIPTNRQIYRVALASIIGSVIEQYDFLVRSSASSYVPPPRTASSSSCTGAWRSKRH